MSSPQGKQRVLLVDDDATVRNTLSVVLIHEGFDLDEASNVPMGMKLIRSNVYDVLLLDLHEPVSGDGLMLVGLMRHTHPMAVVMILNGVPDVDIPSHVVLLQSDQIIVKPLNTKALVATIKERLTAKTPGAPVVDTVANILEGATDSTIADWYGLVQKDEQVQTVLLTREQRTSHLPQLFRELVIRLRVFQAIGSKGTVSHSAKDHGRSRYQQGYTSAMLVEESRMLQVSIFHTLQMNMTRLDFSVLLAEVMVVADEIDSQLSQTMASYAYQGMELVPEVI